MDPEEILKRVAALKLTSDGKASNVTISSTEIGRGNKRADKLVLGKIFGRRQLNRDTLRDKLPEIFQLRGSCEVEIVGANLFVISLDLDTDRERIITEGPWHWFNDLMLVKKVESMRTAANTTFDEISMWIQLHNLPIMCMEPQILRRMGEKVGRVLEIDEGSRGLCLGRYARIRITRSLNEPLVQGIPITTEGAEGEIMVLVLYEKLPDLFCFACGKIGHHMKDCEGSEEGKISPAYGAWLKARRGVDYRRVTHKSNMRAAQPNPRGPRPPPREDITPKGRHEAMALQVAGDANKGLEKCSEPRARPIEGTTVETIDGDMEIDIVERGMELERGKKTNGKEVVRQEDGDGDGTVGDSSGAGQGNRGERMREAEVGRVMLSGSRGEKEGVIDKGGEDVVERRSVEYAVGKGTQVIDNRNEAGCCFLQKQRKTSPKKSKYNPVGKGWKRMARANLLDNFIGSPTKKQDKVGVLGKRREEGDGGVGVNGRQIKRRVTESKVNELEFNESTLAEAAEVQPRQEQ